MLQIGREDILKILTYENCIEWVEEGMLAEGNGQTSSIARFRLQCGVNNEANPGLLASSIAVMCASAPVKGFASIRHFGGTPFRAGMLLFGSTGEPVAVLDFAHIQIYRTGAAGAVGAKYLARPDSHRIGIVGSGRMAKASLRAHVLVRDLTEARVYSRSKANREAFARELSPQLKLNIEPVDSEAEAVRDADIIIACAGVQTLDDPPAFHGALMQPGVHVCAPGAPADLDQDSFKRATRVIVDDKPEVRAELRDIGLAVESGLFTWDELDDLPEIVSGKRPGRTSADEITLLRTRGSAIQDIFPAANLYLKARELGIGRDLGDAIPGRIGF